MVKNLVPRYLPVQEEFENVCFVAAFLKKQKLRLFVQVTLKRSFVLHAFCLCLC